jgi:acyl-CoA oxidase
MLVLSEAYIEKVILDKFYNKIEKVEDENCKLILTKLCQLFALESIQENKGWYLENDYVSGAKTKAIRRVITKLYQELRPELFSLVEAFNIPEELLGAEIAI